MEPTTEKQPPTKAIAKLEAMKAELGNLITECDQLIGDLNFVPTENTFQPMSRLLRRFADTMYEHQVQMKQQISTFRQLCRDHFGGQTH